MGPLEHWVVTSSADCSHTDTTDSTEDAHRWSGSGSNIASSEESFYIVDGILLRSQYLLSYDTRIWLLCHYDENAAEQRSPGN